MKHDEALKFLEGKESEEFELHTKADHNTLIANVKIAYDEDVVPVRIKEIQDKYDNDLFDITGDRRPDAEKTHDFIKRKLSEYYDKAKGVDTLTTERDALQKSIDEGNTDEQLGKDLKKVREDYVQLQTNSENRIKDVNSKFDIYKTQADVRSPLSRIVFNTKFPESVIKSMSEAAVDKLTRKAKMIDGAMVFIDAEGATMRNKNNQMNPYTAEELLKEELKDIIKTDGNKGPAISDEIHKEFNDKGELKKVLITIPNSVNTKIKLGAHLVEKGLLRGTPEYILAYSEYGKELPLK